MLNCFLKQFLKKLNKYDPQPPKISMIVHNLFIRLLKTGPKKKAKEGSVLSGSIRFITRNKEIGYHKLILLIIKITISSIVINLV